MTKPKLFCFDGPTSYTNPFEEIFDVFHPDTDLSILGNIKKADCIIFTGGADISPSLYGDTKIKQTYPYEQRDKLEEVIITLAIEEKKKILGICRGAQLACAFAGGKLYQDVTNHNTTHEIETYDGQKLMMSSIHHQMMNPEKTKHKLLAWSKNISKHYLSGFPLDWEDKEILNNQEAYREISVSEGIEPDTIYFEDIQALGFQGHPEALYPSLTKDKLTLEWIKTQVKDFLI